MADVATPWISPREKLEAQATPKQLALADAIANRLTEFGHHDMAMRRAVLLDLAINVFPRPASPVEGAREAVRDIAQERDRQISGEGWSLKNDDQHTDYSLAVAAATYALGAAQPAVERSVMDTFGDASATPASVHYVWPESWSKDWFKPKSRRADLVRAGALIVAEIERLDRLSLKEIGND